MCILGAHTTVRPSTCTQSLYANHAAHPDERTWHTSPMPDLAHRPAHALTAALHGARECLPICTRSQGSMNIETREGPHRINTRADSFLHALHPQWEAPGPGPPLDTRVTILPLWFFTLPRLLSPAHSQSVQHASCNARRACIHAHSRHGLTVHTSPPPPANATLSLPALREGANSPGRMVRD